MKNRAVFPRYLSIQTTSFCNASCVFCPSQDIKNLFPPKIMEMRLFKTIIDESSCHRDIERVILYMNNEPLTDPDLVERINYAKEKIPWASVHILTNGLLLADEAAERLIDSRLDWIGISFHGLRRETIERSMGIPYETAFGRINNFIEKAKRKKDINNYIMMTFLRHKYLSPAEKEEAINYWRKKGVSRISYFDRPFSRAGNVRGLSAASHRGRITGCRSIWADEMIHIAEDGKVILCCMDWRREVILGDLNSEKIYNIWNGKRAAVWRMIYGEQPMPEGFLCRRCEEAEPLRITAGSEYAKNIEDTGNTDFLLVNLPPWGQDNPHIGIAYLGSYLRGKGLKMSVLDLNKTFHLSRPEFKMLWHVENKSFWSKKNTFPTILEIFKEEINRAVDEIVSSDCDILGFSVVDPKYNLTIEFIKRIKARAPNKRVILGGPATSTSHERRIFLDQADGLIDAFVLGEGEETLFCLLDRLLNKREIEDVEGCYLKDNGGWSCKERPTISCLDSIPFPTYEEFDLGLYGKSLLVEWSRGCRGRCAFCKNYRLFPGYRLKSADWIMGELRHHRERYNITDFTVVDNILNGDLELLDEVCERLKREGAVFRWTGQMAPHKKMGLDFFRKMREAGCFKLQIGFESGSRNVLRLMGKTFTPEVSEANIKSAKKTGIQTEIFIMIGFPGETERDFKMTCDFIKKNAKYIDCVKSINTLHIISGTEIYERAYDKFKMKPLPEENYHYLWQTYDGNTYAVRKERAQRLLDLSSAMGIKVMETNIGEGKEALLDITKNKPEAEKISILLGTVNRLQELPRGQKMTKKKRPKHRWAMLALISLYTLLYITYFYIFMVLKKRVLLGGSIKRRR